MFSSTLAKKVQLDLTDQWKTLILRIDSQMQNFMTLLYFDISTAQTDTQCDGNVTEIKQGIGYIGHG